MACDRPLCVHGEARLLCYHAYLTESNGGYYTRPRFHEEDWFPILNGHHLTKPRFHSDACLAYSTAITHILNSKPRSHNEAWSYCMTDITKPSLVFITRKCWFDMRVSCICRAGHCTLSTFLFYVTYDGDTHIMLT